MKTIKNILVFLTLFTVVQMGFAQSMDTEKLDTYFNTLEDNNKLMGSIAIWQDNEILYHKEMGFSELNEQTQPNHNTKYRIGSISKTFTAVLVFKAIQSNKLVLTETIEAYFPSIKNAQQITIENLLNHRSGIHSFTDEKRTYLSYRTQPKTEKEMVGLISNYNSDFEPNSRAAYSNSNYLLLSYILEKKYQKSFAQILKDEICSPLGLENTYFGQRISAQRNEAYSYKFDKRWKEEPQTDGTIGLGAGSILSTPGDLLTFSHGLFNGELLSQESLKLMTSIKDRFGMGLFKMPYYDLVSYGHNGGIDGFVSMFRYFPKEKIGFALFANGLDYDFNSIETTLVNSIWDKYYDIPIFTFYEPKTKELNNYIGTYGSDSFPVKINVVREKKQLVLKVSGQEPIPLEAFEKGKFKSDKAGLRIEFIPEEKKMLIGQKGQINTLEKE